MGRIGQLFLTVIGAAALVGCASGPVDSSDRSAVARAMIEEPIHDNDIVQTDRSIAVPIVEQAVDSPFGGKRREPQLSSPPTSAPPAEDEGEEGGEGR